MAKNSSVNKYRRNTRHKRPGIHAKTKQSRCKSSKNYFKINIGQGK